MTTDIDPEVKALFDEHYRWWTVMAWCYTREFGVKVGPVSVFVYDWHGWHMSYSHCFDYGNEHCIWWPNWRSV